MGAAHPTIGALLLNLLETLAARNDGVAIIEPAPRMLRWLGWSDRTMSRRELVRCVRAVLAGLQSEGLQPGHAVLFAVRPGIDSIVLMSALLLGGANVIALDPGVGEQVFEERLQALRPGWVIAEAVVFAAAAPGPLRWLLRRFAVEVPNIRVPGATFVCVGMRWPWVPRATTYSALCAHDGACQPAVGATDAGRVALTVFTSGTTASPKAVLHTAASLGAAISIISRHMDLTANDVVYSSQTHQLLAGLLVGAVCVVPPMRPDAQRFVADVARYRASHAYAVPFEMAGVVQILETRGLRLPAHLATIVLGSAPVLPHFLARLRAVCATTTEVWCVYAMTEMFPAALVESLEKLSYKGDGDLVGWPIDGVVVELASDGELMVTGPHCFSQYLGAASTTFHATGDLARLDALGRIVLLGRKKDMIIRGHYNIYPSLYEPRIATIEGVEMCALVGVPCQMGADEQVVLVVQPRVGVDPAALRRRVNAGIRAGVTAIDPFARPDAVIICELPHSGRSLKIDRDMLKALARDALERGH